MIFNMTKKELAIRVGLAVTTGVAVYIGYKYFTKGGDVATTAAATTTPSPAEETPTEETSTES